MGVLERLGAANKEEELRKTVADEPLGESGGARKPIVIEAQSEK